MELIDLLYVITDFIKNGEVEYYEIHAEKDNYFNVDILIDLSNCVNIEIYSNDNQNDYFLRHNTINSNEFFKDIKIKNEEQLKKILNNLEKTGYNK